MSNLCAVMEKQNVFRVENRAVPKIGESEVLIRVEYCGICGSDVHLFRTGEQGENKASAPMILGHEAAGKIVAVGQNVKNLRVGDNVAIEPGRVCRVCEFCKHGCYNLCPNMIFPSTPPHDGLMAQFVTALSDMVFKLPDAVSLRDSSMLEPLACALNATDQGGVGLGSSVAVIGAGCIGLLTLLAAKALGASEIYVLGRHSNRLQIARAKGAKKAIDVASVNPVDELMTATNGQGVDVVIDCSGTQAGMQLTIDIVKAGGTVVFLGMPPVHFVPLNVTKIIWKEVTIKSSLRYRNRFQVALKALAAGDIDLDGIVTHQFDLKDIQHAFDYISASKQEVIKAVVKL